MSQKKLINDPIYGLIRFPFELLYELIDHPYFQRLRRISQMGLSNYVYPGATHSRFSHALGALHLMTIAVKTLRSKGIEITDDEYLGVCVAILLHDIGHGPFSHALEGVFLDKSHEDISMSLMKRLNEHFDMKLSLGIEIFNGNHPKSFLTELVSSQLDMDRLDYLTRDSFYSGVAEGVIGYKRIISMLSVSDNQLVIEEKGIYSVQKFLFSRYIMYLQVYLHKNSIVAEQMLKTFMKRLKYLINEHNYCIEDTGLEQLLDKNRIKSYDDSDILETFVTLDDVDVLKCIKDSINATDQILKTLANRLLNRSLFKIILSNSPINSDLLKEVRQKVKVEHNLSDHNVGNLIISGQETVEIYDNTENEIKVLKKSGEVIPISQSLEVLFNITNITQYYLCYPK